MGLTRKELGPMYQAWANNSVNAYEKAKGRQQTTEEGQLSRDAALAQLIRGKEMDHDSKDTMLTRQINEVERMRGIHGSEVPVNVEGVSIGTRDPLAGLKALVTKRDLNKPQLTPAQEASEKESGKKLATYESAGGRATTEHDVSQLEEVEKEIAAGKRDWYDRKVGGTVAKIPLVGPALMSIVAPTEKARRDKVRGTANNKARQSDPNPTQQQVDMIQGQLYDEAASDEATLARIRNEKAQRLAVDRDMAQASSNLANTGYAMPGLAGQRAPAPQRQAPSAPKTGLEQLSDAELRAMAAKLGIK